MGATENIKEGNEDIREVISLYFKLTCFSLNFQFFLSVALEQHMRAHPWDQCSACWVSGQGFGKTVQGS